MRIERIEIDGFGRFHDAQWALDEGLTVLVGANEAGKTTLLNALRALLFGFEATRDARTWYPALEGGRRGGRLVLRTAAGERWTVERHGDRGGGGALAVRAPNGNQGGQETLDRLLHGADRGLFNNIFAFGLTELQTFDSLSADGVRGRIYGAGAGLGGTSAVDLERRLRQAQEGVFLPRGQRPLNLLLARTEILHGEIADLARQPQEYVAAHRERAELGERASTLRVELRAARERAIRLANLRSAGPLVSELTTIEADLTAGDATLDALPLDAVPVLDRRLADLADAQAALTAIDEQVDGARVTLAGLQVDERLLAAGDEIVALRDERAARSAAEARRRELESAEARHDAAVSEQLGRVGGWPEARLVALDDSITSIEATRGLERGMGEARTTNTTAQERLRAAVDEMAARDGGVAPAPVDRLDERAAIIRQLDELRVRRAAAEASRVAGRRFPRPLVIVSGAVLMVIGLAAGWALGQPLVGGLMGAAVGAVIVALGLAGGTAGATDPGAIADERARLLAGIDLAPDSDDARVAHAAEELAAARARRELARELQADVDLRREELARREREAARTAAGLTDAERAWHDWLDEHQLPRELSPEAARQLLGAAGAARRSAVERDHQRALLAGANRDDEVFVERVDALLALIGHAAPTDPARRMALLAGVVDQLEHARGDRLRANELEAGVASLSTRRGNAVERLGLAEAALAQHLSAVGCADPDALRRRDAAAAERRALSIRARELRAGLAGIAGGADAVPALVAEARDREPAALEATEFEAQAQVEQLEAEEGEALHRIGALEARIRQLEAAEELGERRQELAALEGQAAAIAHQWAVRAVALKLLEETRSRYERERQPDVVRAAASHFERFTAGRYARIVAPPGDASVRVETEGGEGRTTEELSRGTAEQLYLALRFGLIEEFASHAEPLPVIMDDILVNFDAERAARAAVAIRDLAGRHQVIYFTCHPWTAELLDPDGARTLALG